MSGSGVRTGMETTAVTVRRILQVQPLVMTEYFVVAVGSVARGTAVCLIATTVPPHSAATARACVLPSKLQKVEDVPI